MRFGSLLSPLRRRPPLQHDTDVIVATHSMKKTEIKMDAKDGSVGVIANVKTRTGNGTQQQRYIVYCDNSGIGNIDSYKFPLGIFQNYIQLLLISLKNKFKAGSETPSHLGEVVSAELVGLIINIRANESLENYITYATLPFVYLCDNGIGLNASRNSEYGKGIPIYKFSKIDNDNAVFTCFSEILLARQTGNFGISNVTSSQKYQDVSCKTENIDQTSKKFNEAMINKYNQDFLKDGYTNGQSMFDLLSAGISDVNGDAFSQLQGAAFGQVLVDIADRWVAMPEAEKKDGDYNIGAAVFIQKYSKAYKCDRYYTMMRSLNIKGTNKAAHAEVRMSLVLDFLDAINSCNQENLTAFEMFPGIWKNPKNIIALTDDLFSIFGKEDEFVLFSSLLPCYMCEGTIESTEGGYISSINGLSVNLWSSFLGLDKAANIYKTAYYDIDATIDYREVDAFFNTSGNRNVRFMTSAPVYINAYLPNNVDVVYALDPTIPIRSIAVADAGRLDPKVGLSNDATASRYRASGQLMAACSAVPGVQRAK